MTVGKQNDRPDGPELGEILTPFVLKSLNLQIPMSQYQAIQVKNHTHNGLMKMICLHLTLQT